MKLYELAQLLKKIEEGINHRCLVYVRLHEMGLRVSVCFTRCLDQKGFEMHDVWSWDQMHNWREEDEIRRFIFAVNDFIRKQYRELTQDIKRYVAE